MNPSRLTRIGAAIASACALGAQAAPAYHLVDLGPDTFAYKVNAHGAVAGQVAPEKAAVWRDNAWHVESPGKYAEDINDGGDVVGWGQDASSHFHAYQWPHGGGVVELTVAVPFVSGLASVISRDGTVAGAAYDASFMSHCVRWVGGAAEELAVGGSSCYVTGINRHDAIAGTANAPVRQAFIWTDGVTQLLGTGKGDASLSGQLNDKGHMAGTLQLPQGKHHVVDHAALWNGHKWLDLGTLDGTGSSSAYGINAADDVVGTADSTAGWSHGFLYTGGQMLDLVDLVDNGAGWTFDSPSDIGDDGTIVGSTRLAADGRYHAFMLVPIAR